MTTYATLKCEEDRLVSWWTGRGQTLRRFAVGETCIGRMTERRGKGEGELGGRDRAENPSKPRTAVKAWGSSEYGHECFTHCQEFLPRFCLPGPFKFISSKSYPHLLTMLVAVCTRGVKIDHPGHRHKRLMSVPVLETQRNKNSLEIIFLQVVKEVTGWNSMLKSVLWQ